MAQLMKNRNIFKKPLRNPSMHSNISFAQHNCKGLTHFMLDLIHIMIKGALCLQNRPSLKCLTSAQGVTVFVSPYPFRVKKMAM